MFKSSLYLARSFRCYPEFSQFILLWVTNFGNCWLYLGLPGISTVEVASCFTVYWFESELMPLALGRRKIWLVLFKPMFVVDGWEYIYESEVILMLWYCFLPPPIAALAVIGRRLAGCASIGCLTNLVNMLVVETIPWSSWVSSWEIVLIWLVILLR